MAIRNPQPDWKSNKSRSRHQNQDLTSGTRSKEQLDQGLTESRICGEVEERTEEKIS
jgi:hypothetical protein